MQAARFQPVSLPVTGLAQQPTLNSLIKPESFSIVPPFMLRRSVSGAMSDVSADAQSSEVVTSASNASQAEDSRPSVKHSWAFTVAVPSVSATLCSGRLARSNGSATQMQRSTRGGGMQTQRAAQHAFNFSAKAKGVLLSAAASSTNAGKDWRMCLTSSKLQVDDNIPCDPSDQPHQEGEASDVNNRTLHRPLMQNEPQTETLLQTVAGSVSRQLYRRVRSDGSKQQLLKRAFKNWLQRCKVRAGHQCKCLQLRGPMPT